MKKVTNVLVYSPSPWADTMLNATPAAEVAQPDAITAHLLKAHRQPQGEDDGTSNQQICPGETRNGDVLLLGGAVDDSRGFTSAKFASAAESTDSSTRHCESPPLRT